MVLRVGLDVIEADLILIHVAEMMRRKLTDLPGQGDHLPYSDMELKP